MDETRCKVELQDFNFQTKKGIERAGGIKILVLLNTKYRNGRWFAISLSQKENHEDHEE